MSYTYLTIFSNKKVAINRRCNRNTPSAFNICKFVIARINREINTVPPR